MFKKNFICCMKKIKESDLNYRSEKLLRKLLSYLLFFPMQHITKMC